MKDVFAKKFLVPAEIPLPARSQFFGNTLLKAGHLMRSIPKLRGRFLLDCLLVALRAHKGFSPHRLTTVMARPARGRTHSADRVASTPSPSAATCRGAALWLVPVALWEYFQQPEMPKSKCTETSSGSTSRLIRPRTGSHVRSRRHSLGMRPRVT